MPAGRRLQSNTMLYTLITFVGLFIVATTLAIIFYVKSENHRTKATTLQSQINELATSAELQKIGTIVGATQGRKSRLGTMVDYLDTATSLILGGLPEETSAEVKVNTVNRKVKDLLKSLTEQHLDTESRVPEVSINQFVELLAGGQFSTAAERFDETMKNELPADKLEEAWKLLGSFKQQIGTRTERQLDFHIEIVTCEFDTGPTDIKVVYNSNGEVSGLFFVPTPSEVLNNYQGSEELLGQEDLNIEIDDPNTTGLIRIIEKLNARLEDTANEKLAIQQQLLELQNRFDDAMAVSSQKEQTLLAEKEKYQQQVEEITQNYDQLKALMEKTTAQQVQSLAEQLEKERTNSKELKQDLSKMEAEKIVYKNRMEAALKKVRELEPLPDIQVQAYQPDGKIILIDDSSKIVHLDIGSDDHVYQGLTFSVYEKNMPVPKDGSGKAEIEVFNVSKNISAARITLSEIKRPIVLDDIVANLIWDKDKTNIFVVTGEFDLNGDGNIDYGGADKIKVLIEKWGGKVADNISIKTDFLVLGEPPKVRKKPSFEEMEIDPMAMEKHEASLQKLDYYNQVQSQARDLSIPVFNAEKFFHFIGYSSQLSRAGAF